MVFVVSLDRVVVGASALAEDDKKNNSSAPLRLCVSYIVFGLIFE